MAVRTGIAAVSYLNTVPFVYGISRAENLRADLVLSTPAGCIEKFLAGEADIALVPAASLPRLGKDAEIVSSWCLGTAGRSRTAILAGDTPINRLTAVHLPADDPTAAALARYVISKRSNAHPEWPEYTGEPPVPAEGEGTVIAGDRALWHTGSHSLCLDLTEEWKELTDLPFVEAVWVARKSVEAETLDALEQAIEMGVEHMLEALLSYEAVEKDERHIVEAYGHLTENIDYIFDNQKHKALQKFWDSGLKTSLRANPG